MVLLLELPTFRIDVLVSHVCSVVVQDYQTKKQIGPKLLLKLKHIVSEQLYDIKSVAKYWKTYHQLRGGSWCSCRIKH